MALASSVYPKLESDWLKILTARRTVHFSHHHYQEIAKHKIGILERQKAVLKLRQAIVFIREVANSTLLPVLDDNMISLQKAISEVEIATNFFNTQFEDILGILSLSCYSS